MPVGAENRASIGFDRRAAFELRDGTVIVIAEDRDA